eukprot:366539-Chlamydomonas_euryale.AAC.18
MSYSLLDGEGPGRWDELQPLEVRGVCAAVVLVLSQHRCSAVNTVAQQSTPLLSSQHRCSDANLVAQQST